MSALMAVRAIARRPADWTPEELGESLVAWWDAKDASTLTVDGTAVTEWRDKSGNGHDLTQASASLQPTRSTDGVTFASDDYLTADLAANVFDRSYAMAWRPSSTSGYVIDGSPSTGTPGVGTNGTNWVVSLRGVAFLHQSTQAYTNGQETVAVGWTTSTRAYISKFGTVSSSAHSQTPGTTAGTTRVVDNAAGILREMVVTPVLSDADRQRLEGYLAWRWGLQASLATGHPYKSAAPTV